MAVGRRKGVETAAMQPQNGIMMIKVVLNQAIWRCQLRSVTGCSLMGDFGMSGMIPAILGCDTTDMGDSGIHSV